MPKDNSGAKRMEESEMAVVKKKMFRGLQGAIFKNQRPFRGDVFTLLFPLSLVFKELLSLWHDCLSSWPSLEA